MSEFRARVSTIVESAAADLLDLSHRIHAHPELAFNEHRAATWIGEMLDAGGLTVDVGAWGLETAVDARVGAGPVTVVVCAEYDALPAMGHACGHNIIAAAAVGAGLALVPMADELGLTVRVLGTPAEEGGGGKILMLERGAFAGAHAAMMIHPGPKDLPRMPTLATTMLDVTYTGTAAHAGAFPERGVNAADAMTIAQVSLGLLRQHLHRHDRVHGIVTHAGTSPNVVPDRATATYQLRARDVEALENLEPRVRACFEAGATGSGTRLDVQRSMPVYADFRDDPGLMASFAAHARRLGRAMPDELTGAATHAAGSTDMANVSHQVAAIHPMLGIESLPAVPHQADFAAAAVAPAGDRAVIDGAIALAWTALDLATEGRAGVALAGP
jgi:amidohydrolase